MSLRTMLDQWLDPCLAVYVLAPFVVCYWRGTWQLLDHYLWPAGNCYNAGTSLAIGIGVIVVLCSAQVPLAVGLSSKRSGRTTFLAGSRIYTALFAFAGVNHWRGMWHMLECHAGVKWTSATIAALAGGGTLAALGTLRSFLSPPFTIFVDEEPNYFRMQTMFRTQMNRINCPCVLDVLFSVLVIGSLVVFIWWGVWMLLDLFVYPNSVLLSAVTSCVIGFTIALLFFSLQSSAAKCSRNLSPRARLVFEDLFILGAGIGAINWWRGIWMLCDIYFLPDYPLLSNALSHATGIICLVLMHSSNSILSRGVAFDAEMTDGSGCYFQVEYLGKLRKILNIYLGKQKRRSEKRTNVTKEINSTSDQKLSNHQTTRFLPLDNNKNSSPVWLRKNPDLTTLVVIDRETVV